MSKVLYIDPVSGISGDMFLAACVDLGVDQEVLCSSLQSLAVDPFKISFEVVKKEGIRCLATDITFLTHEVHDGHGEYMKHTHAHRHLHHIHATIQTSLLSDSVKSIAMQIFQCIAEAEAKIHGTTIEKVHFHEVGAMDSIIDIIGAAICIDQLQVDQIICGHVPTGYGTVSCDHGLFPIPAPATLEILAGVPIRSVMIEHELTTPTGAAILKTIVHSYSAQIPSMVVEKVGYGAGKKDLEQPNILRLVLGSKVDEQSQILPNVESIQTPFNHQTMYAIETTIDDMQPELYQYMIDQIMSAGAKEVTIVPAIIKKGRNGSILKVLTDTSALPRVKEMIFRESSTLGVRLWPVARESLHRTYHDVTVRGHKISVKVGHLHDEEINYAPEFEDCRQVANVTGIPLKTIYQEAIANALGSA
ncbi:TIGR00299 family protein [Desulfuribacillus stibiiarsenatis]|uniref:Pyridinium-3,5-bisthiocarboxylic acid mononucleotide nickel insertion protein n=1 Tax=Desulfuribacillus stibiiarsenatis TaxID=1390249 RepID=A0A1E5L974_9FIRM|nr:nickel pincer cofactor biosynthesis protein LarC [Desulfuribacillus stibiiarsenatis]OEH86493.1 TIGR00299 family protein [Desulfuribacillus stibiiarsenatis]